jgi:hypothetical protein
MRRIARAPGTEPPLRQALQALRYRYDELVTGEQEATGGTLQPGREQPPDGEVFIEPLEARWQQEKRIAKQRLGKGGLAALADDLHAGIAKWLECLAADGSSTDFGRPVAATNVVLGAHPTYGQITRCRWTGPEVSRDIGLGLLLGERNGMPHDLETKLKMVASSPAPVEVLVLLWPRGADLLPPVHQHLPERTLGVWEQFEKAGVTRRVHLRSVALEDLAPWLALPPWLRAIRTEVGGVPDHLVHRFIAERTTPLLDQVTPRS